jgi:GNAT superfamily N-acetyltransferase
MIYKVRKATLEDLELLTQFTLIEAREAEGSSILEEKAGRGIRAGLEDPSISTYWVTECASGQVVGNISVVKEWSNWNSGYYWWIQSLFVIPEHRGKGVLKLLLSEVKKAAKKENAIDIRLYVHKQNERAIKAYKREGFENANYQIMSTKI